MICERGVCRTTCTSTGDCPAPLLCISGICRQACVEDGDCSPGESCRDGFCLPSEPAPDGGCDGESGTDGDPPACEDEDGDGFGRGCPAGPDCNDHDPRIHPGAEEICGDRRDNDCDGLVDESCPCQAGWLKLCSSAGDPAALTGEMVCRPGYQACENGLWSQTCYGEIGPRQETCNGLDDDCDGTVDEGLRDAVGRCIGSGPVPDEDCGPTGEGNGLDDDGDGDVDEDCSCAVPDYDPSLPRTGQACYTGPIETLGIGLCQGGERSCGADGTWGPCEGQVTPQPELCGDGLDNDCDGFIDESCPVCAAPSEEICNGIDDDCDGIVDEGVRNACGGCGEVAAEDICSDGLDNDCDGIIDEDCGGCSVDEQQPCYPGPPETAGVGTCRWGTRTCDGEFWGACRDYILPGVELCGADGAGTGLDEDCDGEVDEGCGCEEGARRPCGTMAGQCTYGTQACSNHHWGPCQGGVGPDDEICDGIDNDCDGLVDEGLRNACGTCGETCYAYDVDPTSEGTQDDAIDVLPADHPDNPGDRPGISLRKETFIPPYLWAANHTDNTVSKFNTDLLQEEGIYWVGRNPSRTAVDLDGNMWVGGRADGRLTKVLWDTSACPDRNGNNQVDTSTRIAGEMVRLNSEAEPYADECVVYSEVPNPQRLSIRGVAAAPDGKVWIGYTGGGLQWIDPATFELGPFHSDDSVPRWTPDANGVLQPVAGETADAGGVYGLVVDARGLLYTSSVNRRDTLACFDTNTGQWIAVYEGLGCGSYGIGVDEKNRIWLGGWPQCGGVGMFDPDARRFYTFAVPDQVGPTPGETAGVLMPPGGAPAGQNRFRVTGVGVEPATGDVWASIYPLGYTARLRVDENDLGASTWTFIATTRAADNSFLPGVGADLRGVGFDQNGYAWTLGLGSDRIWKLDPATNARAADLPEGLSIGVGAHYTYSDFTGSTALSFTSPRGHWRFTFEPGFDDARVDAIIWEATVPAETSAGIRIRALDETGAPNGPWVPAEINGVADFFAYPAGQARHSIDLAGQGLAPVGHSFEIEIRMTTSGDLRPVVHTVLLAWQRP